MESLRLLAKDGLDKLIDELGFFQSAIGDRPKDIDAANQSIRQDARKTITSTEAQLLRQ